MLDMKALLDEMIWKPASAKDLLEPVEIERTNTLDVRVKRLLYP